MFSHLLPRCKTWALTISRPLTQFFAGLEALPDTIRQFIDEVWLDIFPATTRQSTEWLDEFGLIGSYASPAETLTSRWRAQGGQSIEYLEGVLRSAGFDVYVHPWWDYVGQFSQVGNGLSVFGVLNPAVATMSGTDIAMADGNTNELRTYRFDGTNWAQVGNSLSLGSIGFPALAALSGTDIAFIENGSNELRTYRFDGTDWAQVGNGLSIPLTVAPALAALNGTDVAFISFGSSQLRAYRFDGLNWAQVGNGLSVPGIIISALAALSGTDVAFIDEANDELRTYRFDGTNWAQVGNGLTITGLGEPSLARISRYEVALVDGATDQLRTYRFDGTNWAQVGTSLSIVGCVRPAIAQLRNERIVFVAQDPSELRAYELPRTTRNPLDLLGYGVINIQCGVFNAQCGVELAQTGHQLDDGPVLVNQNSQHNLPQPYPPSDPTKWPYFVYIAGPTMDVRADVSAARRVEFERLVLTIFPTDRWVGLLINYV